MGRRIVLFASAALAVFVISRCHNNDTVTNPAPVPQVTGVPTATPMPGVPTMTPRPGNPTATPMPGNPTPTPAPQPAMATVIVGMNGSFSFTDQQSGGNTTTIHAGNSVHWVWQSGFHSVTSGSCSGACTPDGMFDSGQGSGMTFDHTFPAAGNFPYFCTVHGAIMQGMVVVQ